MKCCILLIMLGLSGCAAAPVALGTGSAAADIVLGEVLKAGSAAVASELVPEALAMVGGGLDRLAQFGKGTPSLGSILPPSGRQKVQYISGMTFVGDGW